MNLTKECEKIRLEKLRERVIQIDREYDKLLSELNISQLVEK